MDLKFIKSLSEILRKNDEERLVLDEWNIFYTYTSFLDIDSLNLKELARDLVDRNFASCVLHKDGTTWFKSNDEVLSGTTVFEDDDYRTKVSLVGKDFESIVDKLDSFAQESWFQSIQYRKNELDVFHDVFLSNYIRVSIGLISARLKFNKINYNLYPTIKIYENGVVIVEFRTISPEIKIDYAEFINLYLNLGMNKFETVEAPVAIVDLGAKAYHSSMFSYPLSKRLNFLKSEKLHSEAVQSIKKNKETSDFIFEVAELTRLDSDRDTLSSIAQTIFSIVGYIASKPRSGFSFFLLGQKEIIKAGDFWVGRPYTFITRFDGQKKSAHQNLKTFGDSLGAILIRSTIYENSATKLVLKDYRYADDYSILLDKSLSLCIWARGGVESQKELNDINNGGLIYGQQAIYEFLEYGYMINRMLLGKVDYSKDLKEINILRNNILDFKTSLKDAPKYGEIREFIESGLKEYGVPDLEDRITKRLSIRLDELNYLYNFDNNSTNRLIAITFGLIASLSLTEQLIEPLWLYCNLPINENQNLQSIIFLISSLFLSTIIVLLIISISRYIGIKNRKKLY